MEALKKRRGFLWGLAAAIASAVLLELSGLWITMVVAGFIGGFLTKKLVKGVAAGFLGTLICWSLYFAAFWALSPHGFNAAFRAIPTFILLTLIFGGILGGLGGAIGSLTSLILFVLKARINNKGKG